MSVTTRHLQIPGGRRLAYALYGAPGGRPVHFLHGFPSSRKLAALVHAQAASANVCLVAADRPGFGESTGHPARSLEDIVPDVEALANHLGHDRFDVVGVSCGGAFALACAAHLPDRIGQVALVAGMGPMDVPAVRREQHPALRVMFALAGRHPWLAAPLFGLDRTLFRGDPARALRVVANMLTAPDRAALAADPALALLFVESMAEAYRQGIGAAMHEAAVIARTRPYRLEDIRVPVHLFQGEADRHVPVAMARHLAAGLPLANLRLFPDEGHLSILPRRFAACLQALASSPRPDALP